MGKRGYKPRPWQERFWERVTKTKTGCWLWTGNVEATRRLRFSLNSQRSLAPRKVAWELVYGTPPTTVLRKPRCGKRLCINPAHTPLGISEADKATIRERWALHLRYSTTLERLGDEYGVTRQRIEQIVNGTE